MVTADDLRGEGYATRLLEQLKQEFKGRFAKMYVKVNSTNKAGISLCCNAGLLSNPNKIENVYVCSIA
jgi:GNAT superfamily N-acetyltransferase